MKKIFTLTGNLLAETSARFAMPKSGGTARAGGTVKFQVGGKGVNVASAAKMLGAETVAAIFTAGEIGQRCKKYLSGKLDTIAVDIEGQTREGLVCIDDATEIETTFLGADVPISQDAFANMIERLDARMQDGDIFALCGSFPAWKGEYADAIMNLCRSKRATVCIDSYGGPLKDFLYREVDLIKINRREFFDAIEKRDDETEATFFSSVKSLPHKSKIFAVSDAANPSVFSTEDEFFALTPPRIKEVSATGCGDIMLASLIVNLYLRNLPLRPAAEASVHAASLAAQHRDISIAEK